MSPSAREVVSTTQGMSREIRRGLDLAQHLEAVDARQPQVEQDQVRPLGRVRRVAPLQIRERGLAVLEVDELRGWRGTRRARASRARRGPGRPRPAGLGAGRDRRLRPRPRACLTTPGPRRKVLCPDRMSLVHSADARTGDERGARRAPSARLVAAVAALNVLSFVDRQLAGRARSAPDRRARPDARPDRPARRRLVHRRLRASARSAWGCWPIATTDRGSSL